MKPTHARPSRVRSFLSFRSTALLALAATTLVAWRTQQATPAAPVAPAAQAASAATALERLIQVGRTDNQVTEELKHLCLEIGPRLTSSTRLTKACEWARDRFKEFGLKASLE